MKVPANIISTGKYTQGNEFMYSDNYESYQGYYYEINNKTFAGKEFNTNAREIIKLDSSKVNKLKSNPETSTYGFLSNNTIEENKASGIVYLGEDIIRYFAKKLNNNPALIREIDKNTFEMLKTDPIYQTIAVNIPASEETSLELEQADKQMPGLKDFLLG